MADRSRQLGLLLLFVTSVGWGLNWPAMRVLLQQWPPLFSRGTAGLAAALMIMLGLLASGQRVRVAASHWRALCAGGFFNVFAWMGFSTLCMQWLPAAEGALLVYTMPAWAVLFAWALRGQRPTSPALLGLVLCFAGVGVLLLGHGGSDAPMSLPGVLFALAAAVSFALGTVTLKPLNLPAFPALAWQLVAGCLPMVVYGLLFERPQFDALSPVGWGLMAYMTLVPMGACYLAWFAALRRLPASLASISTLLVPVVGVLSSTLMLGEAFTWRHATALVLTLTGIALALRR